MGSSTELAAAGSSTEWGAAMARRTGAAGRALSLGGLAVLGLGLGGLILLASGCPGSAELSDGPVMGPARSAVHLSWIYEDDQVEQLLLSSVPDLCAVTRRATEDLRESEETYLLDATALHSRLPMRDWNRIDCETRLARARRDAEIQGRLSPQNSWLVTVSQGRWLIGEGTFSADLDRDDMPHFEAELVKHRKNPHARLESLNFDCDAHGDTFSSSLASPEVFPFSVTAEERSDATVWRELSRGIGEFTARPGGFHLEVRDGGLVDTAGREEGTVDLRGTFTPCEIDLRED